MTASLRRCRDRLVVRLWWRTWTGRIPDSGTCWEYGSVWGASPWPPNRHPCSEAESFGPYNLAAPVGGFHSGLSMEIGVRDRGHDLRRKRMRLRGLSGARDEFHLAAIVQNLKTLANPRWNRILESAIWLPTLNRSFSSAISSGVSPTRLRRGATGTPALLRRAIARRERPPCAIGIEAKSCSKFRA